jgi:hypothetical protein
LNPYTPFLEQKTVYPETARRFEAGTWNKPGFLKDCIGVRPHDPKGYPIGYAGHRLNLLDIKKYGKKSPYLRKRCSTNHLRFTDGFDMQAKNAQIHHSCLTCRAKNRLLTLLS